MSEQNDYLARLGAALDARQSWLERTDMPKLKEDFRAFLTALMTLYSSFVKKGYITDDPYRSDAKTDDLKVPDTGPLTENNKRDQIGQRMSNLSKELDYLVAFYSFSIEHFTQSKIKIMMGLVGYINWLRLSPDSDSPITQAMNTIITEARNSGLDPVSRTTLNEAVVRLGSCTTSIAGHLKLISEFNREKFKYDLRAKVTASMTQASAKIPEIKKRFMSACPGQPFSGDLAEELIREDYSPRAAELQEAVLKKLAVADEKPKVVKQAVNYKLYLIEALNALGSTHLTFAEISQKIAANHEIITSKKRGFFDALKKVLAQMSNKEPEPFIYELEYPGANTGKGGSGIRKEKLNYNSFTGEIEKLSKILQALAANGSAQTKLEGMEEEQLAEFYQRYMKEILVLHKTLGVLDEYFKANIDKTDKGKVRGIKPELGALKNATLRASEKFAEYNAVKEEEAQFKKLGIDAAD
ncbi:MAG: hypothetical protein LBT01_06210 [Spirochaetaceae bacterium]|nr:hypothetical protein [Spirochaetaceae bacterium]